MAITKKIEIDVSTVQAVGGLENLSKALEKVDAEARSVDKTFEEVYGDLQPLTTRMGEAEDRLYELALAGQSASKEYQDLLATVSNYRRVQIQTDMAVDASATTFNNKLGGALQGITSGFAATQGVMAAFGTESKDLEQALVKVQGAMALSEGIRGIRESASSFRALLTSVQSFTVVQKISTALQYAFNAAMSANPIGVVTTAIIGLVAAGYKLISWYQDSAEANDLAAKNTAKNTQALKTQSKQAEDSSSKLKDYNKYQYDLAKASGASAEELRKLALKHKDEEIALNQKNTMLARSTFLRERDTLASLKNADASEEVIKAQEKLTQDTYKEFEKQRDNYYQSKKDKVALIRQQNVEIKQAETDHNKELADKRKEAREKELEEKKKQAAEDKKFLEEKLKNEIQYRKDYMDLLELSQKNEKDYNDQLKLQQDEALTNAIDNDNARVDKAFEILNKIRENESLTISQRLEDNKFYTNQLLSDTQLTQDQIDAIKQKSNENEIILNKLKNEAIVADGMNTLAQIGQLAGEGTAIAKAVSVAQATMSGYEGVVNAYKTAQKSPITVFFPGYPVVQAGLAGAFAAMQIKKILSVQKPTAGGGGSSNMSVGGGSSAPTPQFNVVGNSGINQITATIGQQQPIQAYVVANNVTTAQAMNRNIIENASIG